MGTIVGLIMWGIATLQALIGPFAILWGVGGPIGYPIQQACSMAINNVAGVIANIVAMLIGGI